LGPSIEPEKASLKSASTANPPQKVNFIAFLMKIYRLNGFGMFFNLYLVLGIDLSSSIFWYSVGNSTLVFLDFLFSNSVVLLSVWVKFELLNSYPDPLSMAKKEQHGGRGRLQAQYTGADTGAGNNSRPNFTHIA
jgi:hypothetical protein